MNDTKNTSGAQGNNGIPPITIDPREACGCNPAIAEAFIGETFTEALYAEIKRRANGNPVRPMGGGYAGTTEVRPDRLNLNLDNAKRIISITCG